MIGFPRVALVILGIVLLLLSCGKTADKKSVTLSGTGAGLEEQHLGTMDNVGGFAMVPDSLALRDGDSNSGGASSHRGMDFREKRSPDAIVRSEDIRSHLGLLVTDLDTGRQGDLGQSEELNGVIARRSPEPGEGTAKQSPLTTGHSPMADHSLAKRVVIKGIKLEGVYFISFKVLFDPEKYQPVSVKPGKALDEDKNLLFALLDGSGQTPVGIARVRPDKNGLLSGSGDLLEIEFRSADSANTVGAVLEPPALSVHTALPAGSQPVIETSSSKLISKPPTQDPNNEIKVTMDLSKFSWNEARWGDWNNDGSVDAKDIVPIAYNFGKTSNPDSPDYYKYAQYVDGNRDGIVNAGDIMPIAFHYGEGTESYSVFEAEAPGEGSPKLKTTVKRPTVPDDPDNPPTYKSFATLIYEVDLRGYPIGEAYFEFWYQVSPGDPVSDSSVAVSSWVQYIGAAKGWSVEIVEPRPTDWVSAALDPNGVPALLCTGPSGIKFVRSDGSSWKGELLFPAGYSTWSLAYSPTDGNPSFTLGGESAGGLKFVKWDGSSWQVEMVDPETDDPGMLVYDDEGNPNIAYWYLNTGTGLSDLRFAKRTASSWTKEVIYKGIGLFGGGNSIAIDPVSGEATVALGIYGQGPNYGYLNFLRRNRLTGEWRLEVVDADEDTGHLPQIVYGPSGPSIAYGWRDDDITRGGGLKFAWWDGSKWVREGVATASRTLYPSLAYYSTGEPVIAFWWGGASISQKEGF